MSDSEDDPIGRRETAYRLFATEFEDSDFSYAESDEERAPNYVVTPSGARINRLFVVGVLTEVQPVSEDVLRARVVDPTGAFVIYAGQYQPDAQTFLERADPPTFVAVSGKARTFQPDDSDVIYTSIRPESINEVDADTRDRWVVQATEQTLDRVGAMAAALESDMAGEELQDALETAGTDEALAAGIPLAIHHYGTAGPYLSALRETALDAARVVAGDLDEVDVPSTQPDAPGEADLEALATVAIEEPEQTSASTEPTATVPDSGSGTGDSRVGTAGETAPESTTDEQSPSADEGSAETTTADTDGPGDFDPGEFELDEETREEVESEYGTDFQSGTEVDEPGEANIETPDPEDLEEAAGSGAPADAASTDSEDESEATAAPDTEAVSDASPESAEPVDEDVDLEDAVMDAMRELDAGDGAEREAIVETVGDQTGADPDAVGDAIQDALMNGRCYEPDDTTLKPI